MYIKGEFKKINDVDITDLKALVSTFTTEQWAEHGLRQEVFDAHRSTQTIPLIYDSDYRHRLQTTLPNFELLNEALSPIMSVIKEYFKEHTPKTRGERLNRVENGYFVRVILVKLQSNSEISQHVDNGYSLCRSHRIHLPIITNNKVEFTIDGVTKIFLEGELCEINNRGVHSVKNISDEERVHVILDFVIPDEIVEDPISGTLYA